MPDDKMTEQQYRCLVAYMLYWGPLWEGCSLDQAIKDVGITASRDSVIHSLFKAGYDYDSATDRIRYTLDDDTDLAKGD